MAPPPGRSAPEALHPRRGRTGNTDDLRCLPVQSGSFPGEGEHEESGRWSVSTLLLVPPPQGEVARPRWGPGRRGCLGNRRHPGLKARNPEHLGPRTHPPPLRSLRLLRDSPLAGRRTDGSSPAEPDGSSGTPPLQGGAQLRPGARLCLVLASSVGLVRTGFTDDGAVRLRALRFLLRRGGGGPAPVGAGTLGVLGQH